MRRFYIGVCVAFLSFWLVSSTTLYADESSPEEGTEVLATYALSVDNAGKINVRKIFDSTSEEGKPLSVVVVPDNGASVPITSTNAGAANICFTGVEALRLGSGWFQNPPPDWDFFIDYRLPKKNREWNICITAALWTALRLTERELVWNIYNHNNKNYRVRIVIGSTIVRRLCEILTGGPDCANWLLEIQAGVRFYRR